MATHKNGSANGGNGKVTATFIIKEWIAIGIAGFSLVFSAGGWYFKVTELEKRLDTITAQVSTDYVRKDVLGATLNDIQRQLADQSSSLQKLDIKLDGVTVAINTKK